MAKYATHILIGFIALVAGISAPVTVYIMRPPAVTPGPDVEPVVATYTANVKAACANLTGDERDYAATQYRAMLGVTQCERQPKDDGEYQQVLESVRTAFYKDPYPFKESLKPLHDVAFAEAEKRGLIESDWDREKWQKFAEDTLLGILP